MSKRGRRRKPKFKFDLEQPVRYRGNKAVILDRWFDGEYNRYLVDFVRYRWDQTDAINGGRKPKWSVIETELEPC